MLNLEGYGGQQMNFAKAGNKREALFICKAKPGGDESAHSDRGRVAGFTFASVVAARKPAGEEHD